MELFVFLTNLFHARLYPLGCVQNNWTCQKSLLPKLISQRKTLSRSECSRCQLPRVKKKSGAFQLSKLFFDVARCFGVENISSILCNKKVARSVLSSKQPPRSLGLMLFS